MLETKHASKEEAKGQMDEAKTGIPPKPKFVNESTTGQEASTPLPTTETKDQQPGDSTTLHTQELLKAEPPQPPANTETTTDEVTTSNQHLDNILKILEED